MMTKASTQQMPRQDEDDDLSALFDGELGAERARLALRTLGSSPRWRERYDTYCAIGDALRGTHAPAGGADLTARVMAALEQEPTVLAPMRGPRDRRASLWLAAAAVGAITWGLWSQLPEPHTAVPLAANDAHPPVDVQPYLAAHQDFAQAVISPAEMNFTQVSLAESRP